MKEKGVLLALLLIVPLLTGFTLHPGQIHNPDPSIELTYSDAVHITGGSLYDATGRQLRTYGAENFTDTSGNNTIFVIPLGLVTPGDYRFEVQKTEAAPPNKKLEDDVIWFSYAAAESGLQIALDGTNVLAATFPSQSPTGVAVPETLFARQTPYTARFDTTKPAWECRYSSTSITDPRYMALFSTTGTPTAPTTTHTITGQQATLIEPLIVWCNSSAGPATQAFVVGYEKKPPHINAKFTPDLIVDPLQMWTNLSITTDQKVYCEVTDGTDTHTSVEQYGLTKSDAGAYLQEPWIKVLFAAQPNNKVVKALNLTCWDRAGWNTTQQLSITIDLDQNPSIDQLAPARYAMAAPLLSLRVVKAGIPVKSARCFFGTGNLNLSGDLQSDDGIIYTKTLPSLSDGAYSQTVTCTIANGERVDGTIDFVLDTQAPPERTLTVPDTLCGDEPLTAIVNSSKYIVEDPNFAGYLYNITYSKGNVVLDSGFQPGPDLIASVVVEENETYRWSVWPVDLAGNKGRELNGLTRALAPGSTLCDHEPPVGFVDVRQVPSGALVSIRCDDGDGSGCTDNYRYDKLSANATPSQCAYASTEPYGHNLTFYENGVLCYYVEDKNQNNDTGFKSIAVEADVPNASSHCNNGVLDSGLETGVDCGGQCPAACGEGNNCVLDADCQSGFCNASNQCEAVSCTDAIKNGRETDVDCGGPTCPACLENSSCTGNSDCDFGFYCEDGICTEQPSASECDTNSDCAAGEECLDGVCVRQSECTTDADCGFDETCESGRCITTTTESQSSLLGIILIILGLLTMGGSSYWLYILHQQREEETTRTAAVARPATTRPVAGITPEQRLALAKQRQAQLAAMKARAKARAAAKEAKRKELLEKFGGEQKTVASEESTSEKSDEFIDVRDVGKKERTYTKAAAVTTEPVKKQDVFTELDEVVGDTTSRATDVDKEGADKKDDGCEDAFSELDEVIDDEHARKNEKKRGGKGA